jgi:hypothetical protein
LNRRRLALAAAATALLAAVAFAAWQFALRQLKSVVADALGPRAEIERIDVGLARVVVSGLRLRGEPGRWPAADELRAERVAIAPDLGSVAGALFGRGAWAVHRIDVEGAYLSVQRTRAGALKLLPGLLDRPAAEPAAAAAAPVPLRIGRVHVSGTVELFDASVRQPPHRLQLQALDAQVGPLLLPALDQRVDLRLRAQLSGVRRGAGTVELSGWVTPATRDADLEAKARQVDLLVLAPYIVKASDVAVTAGTLDLALKARVERQRLSAPGRLVLRGLELGGQGGALGSFAGVPAQLVLAAVARDGGLEVPFTLQGRLDDPGFSLNTAFGSKLAIGLAEKLGLSVGGVVEELAGGIKGLFDRTRGR